MLALSRNPLNHRDRKTALNGNACVPPEADIRSGFQDSPSHADFVTIQASEAAFAPLVISTSSPVLTASNSFVANVVGTPTQP